MGSRENYDWSVDQQNNNNPKFGKSKNKNIDHQVKETCAIMSTQVASTSLYFKCTKFLLFYVYHCNLKE